jgi:hypothetical protein
MNILIFIVVTLSLLVSACTSTLFATLGPGLYTIPTGSIVKLNQPLTIRPQRVTTAVQYGKPTISVNPYEPHCKFEVNTIAEETITLPAADYRITRVIRYSDPFFSRKPVTNKMVASSSETTAWLAIASPDSDWYYTTVFRLESTAHPDVRQLVCGIFFPSGFQARDITLEEFEALAGDVMTLQVVDK